MTPETEARIAEMRAEIAELRQAASERRTGAEGAPKIEGLASGSDPFELSMKLSGYRREDRQLTNYSKSRYEWKVGYMSTWNDILHEVGPSLMDEASEREITAALRSYGITLVRSQTDRYPRNLEEETSQREISPSSVDDVLVQLFALGLIAHGVKKRTMSDPNRYWTLTPAGQDQVMMLRAIRRPSRQELEAARREELRRKTVPVLRTLALERGVDATGVKGALIEAILGAESKDA